MNRYTLPRKVQIRDPGSGLEKSRSGIQDKHLGSGINIADPQHCFAGDGLATWLKQRIVKNVSKFLLNVDENSLLFRFFDFFFRSALLFMTNLTIMSGTFQHNGSRIRIRINMSMTIESNPFYEFFMWEVTKLFFEFLTWEDSDLCYEFRSEVSNPFYGILSKVTNLFYEILSKVTHPFYEYRDIMSLSKAINLFSEFHQNFLPVLRVALKSY
jgi:hypothetical protein